MNRIGSKEELDRNEKHILVPLMFTQSGTKPMTSIEMSIEYVKTYEKWKYSDRVVVVGFGFGNDDEHINGILRTLIDIDDKKIIVITTNKHKPDDMIAKEIARKLKTTKLANIEIIQVSRAGFTVEQNKAWTEVL